jgi:hypothetical protein
LRDYIARPAVALERLSQNSHGQVIYKLKKPYDDGTTHIVLTPLELLERLAAIVPRPRVHLTRFSGVFGPHYKWRALIVPKPKTTQGVEVAPTLALVQSLDKPPTNSRISWAKLLKRVFNIDVEICSSCGGKNKIIAAIENPSVIKKILKHLGLPTTPPTPWNARGPPQSHDDFNQQNQFDLA